MIERFTCKVKRRRRAFTRFEQSRRRCLRFWHFAPTHIRPRCNANPPRHNCWFRNPLEHTTVPVHVPTLRRFHPRNLPGLSPSPPSAQWSADEYCNLSGRAYFQSLHRRTGPIRPAPSQIPKSRKILAKMMTPAHCRLRNPSVIINLCQVGKKSGSARANKEGNGHSSASNRNGPSRLLPLLFYGAVGQATGDATTLGVGFKTAANHIGLNSAYHPPAVGADNQPQNSGRAGSQQPTRYRTPQ